MKLSIITVNRNNAIGLRKTLESVSRQNSTDFEYLIIDGASNDESLDIIKEYSDKINYWISEPDSGIYNAMNKGILKAQGEYLLFLNSGDWLADQNVLNDLLQSDYDEDFISGDINYFFNEKNIVYKESIDSENMSFDYFIYDNLPHQATFIKRKLFKTYDLYNEKNNIISDFEFNFKCVVVNNCSYRHIKRLISYYDMSGLSSQEEWRKIEKIEKNKIFNSYLPVVNKSITNLLNEIDLLKSREKDYSEYQNLKNGKFSILLKFILILKKISKKMRL